jgi:hypothetical protein
MTGLPQKAGTEKGGKPQLEAPKASVNDLGVPARSKVRPEGDEEAG